MIKENIKKTFFFLALASISQVSFATPYSSWNNEREYSGESYHQYRADQSPLPYSGMVQEYYYGTTPEAANMQMKMGLMFEKGLNGVPVNVDEAANWYNKAAKNGVAEAGYKLYEYTKINNNGEATDIGLDWLNFSSQRGYSKAAMEMGDHYSKNLTASDENLIKAVNYYSQAERDGVVDARNKIRDVKSELRHRGNMNDWSQFWKPFHFSDN